jgi:hypothetical protein
MDRLPWGVASERFVEALRASLTYGGQALAEIPDLVEHIIAEGIWKRRPANYRDATVLHFTVWADFVRAEAPAGLEQDPVYVAKLCRGTPAEAALASLDGHQGQRTDLVSNGNEVSRPVGQTRAYAYRRLKADRADLYARVTAGELTPHAAMVEAGFRRRTLTVPDDPAGAWAALIRRFGAEAMRAACGCARPSGAGGIPRYGPTDPNAS